jgi:hypothetical protein
MHLRTLLRLRASRLRRTAILAAVGVSITLLAVLFELLLWKTPLLPQIGVFGSKFTTGSESSIGWTVRIRRDGRAVFSNYDDRRDLSNSGDVPTWSRARTPATPLEQDGYLRRYEEVRGFPFLCLLSSQTQTGSDPTWYPEWGLDPGFEVKPEILRKLYPVKPIWTGLLLNICFYAGLAFAVSAGFRRVRAAARARRGACRACGHPLAGLARCPECGTVVK